MAILGSVWAVICRLFRTKQGQTVELNVGGRWNSLIIYSFFIHTLSIGCVQVARI